MSGKDEEQKGGPTEKEGAGEMSAKGEANKASEERENQRVQEK